MTKHVVGKPFATRLRRFAVGQEVAAADIDGALSFADWVRLGFIATHPAERKAKEPPEPE